MSQNCCFKELMVNLTIVKKIKNTIVMFIVKRYLISQDVYVPSVNVKDFLQNFTASKCQAIIKTKYGSDAQHI